MSCFSNTVIGVQIFHDLMTIYFLCRSVLQPSCPPSAAFPWVGLVSFYVLLKVALPMQERLTYFQPFFSLQMRMWSKNKVLPQFSCCLSFYNSLSALFGIEMSSTNILRIWAGSVPGWPRRPVASWLVSEIAWPAGLGKWSSPCTQHWWGCT